MAGEVEPLPSYCGSWVIVRDSDGEAVMETFSSKVAHAINRKRYTVKAASTYLAEFNRQLSSNP